MQTEHFRRAITMVVIMTMLVTMIPCRYVLADDYGNESTLSEEQAEAAEAEEWDNGSDAIAEKPHEIGVEEEPLLEEVDRSDAVEEDNTENSTTFDLGDNRKLLVMYGGDVRFRDEDGDLVEYDSELVPIRDTGSENGYDLSGYAYENMASDHKQYLPDRITEDKPVILESEDKMIEMVPVIDSATSEVEIEQETDVNAYEEAEEKDLKAVYEDETTGNVFTYTSLNEGLKEEITIPEKPVGNTLRFRLKLDGLVPEKQPDGSIVLKDIETGEEEADIQKPTMNDAGNDAYSEDIETYMEEEEEPDTYTFTMTISRKYLNSRERIYPVTVDPTVTWRSSDYVGDTYIRSKAADTNYFKSSVKVIKVGRSSAGTHRGYIKIYPLRGKVTGKYVTSAKMMVRESSASNANKTVGAYAVKTSWNLPVITWNNRASYYTTALDTKKTNGNTGHTLTFDITSWARDLANGSKLNYGLMLKNTSENDGTFAEFRGTSYGTAAYRPKFVVEYTDGPTKASSVSVKKAYIKPGESAKVSWKGIKSAGLAHIQYRVARYDTSTGKIADKYYVPYTSFSSSHTSASGTDVTIPGSSGFPEGKYRVYIRGIDNGGIAGTGVGANIYVDGTAPAISDFEIDPETDQNDYTGIRTPELSWNVTEKYLSAVNVYVDGNEAGSLSTASCDGYLISEGIIRTSGIHQIHITAVDKSGNTASTQDLSYYVDIDPPYISSFTAAPQTTFSMMSDNEAPVLSWTITDNDLESVCIYRYDDGEYDELYEADDNDLSQGSYTVNAGDLYEGRNVFKVSAEDSGGQSSFRTCTYYLDTEAPYVERVGISPQTGYLNGSGVLTPTISWSYIDRAISKVKYSMNGTSYSDMGSTKVGSFTLPEESFSAGAGTYTIYVKAVDTAGNESAVSTLTYHLTGVTEADLIPENIEITEYYGRNIITWSAEGYCPALGKIKIYRGSTADFSISDGVLIEEDADNGIYTDNFVGSGDTYYRIVVVSEEADHHIIYQSSALHGTSMLRISDLTNGTGIKEYLRYHEFSAPSGTGTVELSTGNLRYTETDYDISNGGQDYGLSRSYNSLDVRTTAFGRGVSDPYHKAVYEDGFGNAYYIDGNGTIYRFVRSGTEYSMEDGKDLSLTVTQNGYEIEDKDHNVISFDRQGRATGETDPNGIGITYVYDRAGRLDRVRSKADTAGDREIRMHYEGDSMLIKSIDLPDDTIMRYSYLNGMLTAVSHIRNTELTASPYVRYTCNSESLVTIEDALENEFDITYTDGRVTRITDPLGERDDISYGDTVTVTHKTASGAQFGQTEYSLDNDTGKVLWEEDAGGNRTSYEYTQTNEVLVKKVKTKTGWEEVNSSGAVSIHSQENVVETEYTYNGNEDVIREESSDGTATVTTYDQEGNVVREKEYSEDTLISDTEYGYDEYGNETEAEEHVADTLELTEYDEEGNEIEEEEQEESITTDITTSEYDDCGNAVETTSVSGDVETEERNTYDAMGRVLKEVTEDAVTEYVYDVFGRVVRTDISRDGHTFRTYTMYNGNGEVVSETDERGNVTTYTYDGSGRRISTDSPGTGISRTVYGYAQNITIRDGISGKTYPVLQTETEMDADNNVVSVRYMDVNGETVREKTGDTYTDHTFDASGNDIVDVIWSDGTQDQIISLSLFNEKGQRYKEVRKPEISVGSYLIGDDSVVTTATFTDTGDTYTEEDALGNIKRYEYDEQGRVTDIYIGAGQDLSHDMAVSYSITDSGQETMMTDGNGNMRREIENHAGLTVLSEDLGQDGERIRISSEYDDNGNNIADTYSDGSRVTYSYDACNRMTGKTCTEASGNIESHTTYTYTHYGETDTVSFVPSQGASVVTEYEYDTLGRAVKETSTYGSDPSAVTEYVYDNKGRVATVKYPAQASIPGLTYEYDALGRVVRIKTYQTNDTVREYSYGPFSRVSCTKDYVIGTNSFLKTVFCYDDIGRIVSKVVKKNDTNDVIERYDVSYDKADRITELTRGLNNGDNSINETRYYSYDDHGRLIRTGVLNNLDEPDDDQQPEDLIQYTEYEYDAAGNRVQMTDGSGTTTFTYNGLDQLVYQDAPEKEVEFSYDIRGNLIEEENITDDVVRHNEWSVTGQLLSVSDEDESGTAVIQQNMYDDDGTRIQKTEGSSTKKYYYVGNDMAVTTEGTDTVFTGVYDSGEIIGAYLGNVPEYDLYCTDMQGSTSALIDDSLDISGGYRYSDYGEVTSFEDTPSDNEVCYTGAVYDSTTGEQYLRARYYDPETAVFTAQDILKGGVMDESLWNSYAYCNGDPVNNTDSTGHYSVKKTIKYANKYAPKHNPKYPVFREDCTNFVSQCVFAGGIKMTKPRPEDGDDYSQYRSHERWHTTKYWYMEVAKRPTYRIKYSTAWTLVVHLWKYNKTKGKTIGFGKGYNKKGLRKRVRKGDIVQCRHKSEGWHHSIIVTKVKNNGSTVMYRAHGHTGRKRAYELSELPETEVGFRIIRQK